MCPAADHKNGRCAVSCQKVLHAYAPHELHIWLLMKRPIVCVQKAGGPAAISLVELAGANGQFQDMNNVRRLPKMCCPAPSLVCVLAALRCLLISEAQQRVFGAQ